MPTLRQTGITVCALVAAASLVYGVIELANGSGRVGGSYLAWAGLFGVSAELMRSRAGWRRVGAYFGLLMLGVVVLYVVLVELHAHGHLHG
jgi:hypothetical protein